jgi:molybdopterin-guanine dinucleotide biosynthesis protein A
VILREAVSIAILAGGGSRRFGGIDKQGLDFRGESLGRRAARNALASGCRVLVVGTNRQPYEGLPVRFAEESFPGRGPLSGLHAALRVSETPWVCLTACDMPFFSLDWLDELIAGAARGGALVVAARRGGFIEPFQALYARDLAERAASMLENNHETPRKHSLANLIAGVALREVPESVADACSPDGRIFLSANSPRELEYLQALE